MPDKKWRQYCKIPRNCQYCGKKFLAYSADIKRGWGKYCSHKCQGKGRPKYRLSYGLPILQEWEWGYIAGFIDGEGYLKSDSKNLIAISNTDKNSIKWLSQKLDNGYTETRYTYGNRKTLYTLRINRKWAILKILEKVLPYLIIKRGKAKIMIKHLKKELAY